MFRCLAGILAIVMISVFSGCGGEASAPQTAPAAAPVQQQPPTKAAAPVKTAEKAAEAPPPVASRPPAPTSPAPSVSELPAVTPEAQVSGARILSPEPVYDFGEVDSEEKVEHAFVIRNVGTDQLEIRNVRTSCGCTVAQPDKKSLAPGEETKVSATLSLKGRQGAQTKTITIESNDPENPTYKLEFKGTAVAAITVEPRMVNFGRIPDNESKSETIRIWSTKPDLAFKVESVEVLGSEQVKAELKEVQKGKEYALHVALASPLNPGNLNARVTLKTDYPAYANIPVTVFAVVVGDLDIAPNEITLRFSEEPDKKSTQYLRVSPGRVKEFKITSVETPVPGMLAEVQERSPNDYLIKVIDMPLDDTLEGKELLIHTDVESMSTIRVPFKIVRIPALRAAPSAIGTTASDAARRPAAMKPPALPQVPTNAPSASGNVPTNQ